MACFCVACGPIGTEDTGPAFIVAEPAALSFGADDDALILTLKNTGGKSITFSLQSSAQSNGVTWLEVSPAAGNVEPGGLQSLLVQVINRNNLPYGTYEGSIQIDAPGLVLDPVPVSMVVGKPILQVEPGDEIDFGTDKMTQTVTIRNAGEGQLTFSLHLPEEWMTTEVDLTQSIGAGEPQTITLAVDRTLAPWYGSGNGDLVVTSNGAQDGPQGDSVTVSILLSVDPSCLEDADCQKPGYFCGWMDGSGQCVLQEQTGSSCTAPAECASGFCVEGTCCQSACDQSCYACNQSGLEGKCAVLPDGSACDDGSSCTANETCMAGACGGTADCTALDNPCAEAVCDEAVGECVEVMPEDKCIIEDDCIAELTGHETVPCLQCLPGKSPDDWSVAEGKCYIEETCLGLGEPTGEVCRVCDPSMPFQGSPAPDGETCTDDEDDCTEDACVNGLCEHLPSSGNTCNDFDPCTQDDVCDVGSCSGQKYDCDDLLECTEDQCNGDGTCTFTTIAETCLIEDTCYEAGTLSPNGCQQCDPALSQNQWSPVADKSPCDDGNGCTLEDKCLSGFCVGEVKDCDDGLDCTEDLCSPGTGECGYAVLSGHCLIGEDCFNADDELLGSAGCSVCTPDEAKMSWTAISEGQSCDDGVFCTQDDICGAGMCSGTTYTCDDKLDCTEDECNGDGTCTHVTGETFCVVDGICYPAETPGPGGCTICSPGIANDGWTFLDDATPCDDGDMCTLEDQCQQGICQTVPKDCTDGLDCTKDICDSGSGDCAYAVVAETCLVDGACRASGDVAPGSHGCALCKPEVSTNTWTALGDNEPCDDGQFCTVGDNCSAGICQTEPRSCPDNACNKGVCDEVSEECAWVVKDDGILCNDDDVCTVSDICLSGLCEGEPKDCSDFGSDPCVTGVCNPDSEPLAGACVPVPKEDGEPCQLPGAQASCFKQACIFDKCLEGAANCNGKLTDGCEVQLAIDPENCGECEKLCEFDNATAMCAGSNCYIMECLAGFSDCDKVPESGCETNAEVDPNHCGGCSMPCHDGEFYKNASVECLAGECNFVACMDGFADEDKDCEPGGSCFTGCEECSPLADGTIEIPDDGADNDCVDGDSYNSQYRGFYVDAGFPFGALCPAPGVGDRNCPFEDIAWALLEAQVNQDWSDPAEVKREIYVASGVYEEVGTVIDLFKPLMVLGGYQRTAEGPWTRNDDGVGSELIAGQGAAVIGASLDDWAVLDGFKVTPLIQWSGKLMVSRVSSDEEAPLSIEALSDNGPLVLRHSSVTGGITLNYNDGSLFRYNKIGGDVYSDVCCHSNEVWTFVGNEIAGNLQVDGNRYYNSGKGQMDNGSLFVLEDNVIGGNVHCRQFVIVNSYNNNAESPIIRNSSKWTLTNNTIVGSVALTMDFQCHVYIVPRCPYSPGELSNSSQWILIGNTIYGNVVSRTGYEESYNAYSAWQGMRDTRDTSKWRLEGNSILGKIQLLVDPREKNTPWSSWPTWTLRTNILSGDTSTQFLAANGASLYKARVDFVNNTFVRNGQSAQPAVKFGSGTKAAFINNAFVSLAAEPAQPVTAIQEVAADGDVTVLRNNSFIGFDAPDHIMLMNEGSNPLNNAAMLNMLSDLPECGRGENFEVAQLEEAGFVSVDPDSDDFLQLTSESNLVDGGLALPSLCGDVEYTPPDTDPAGLPVPCSDEFAVGAWQYCPEQ
jgi:hypothetical protein